MVINKTMKIMAQVETEVKQKLAFVKQRECDRLMAMADYIYATCKAIAMEKDRDPKCEGLFSTRIITHSKSMATINN